jgi:hypothetical protein
MMCQQKNFLPFQGAIGDVIVNIANFLPGRIGPAQRCQRRHKQGQFLPRPVLNHAQSVFATRQGADEWVVRRVHRDPGRNLIAEDGRFLVGISADDMQVHAVLLVTFGFRHPRFHFLQAIVEE